MKKFKTATGLDLWATLFSFIAEYENEDARELALTERLSRLYEICNFDVAAHAFHSLITDNSIPLIEIEDAMFRVGWMPSVDETDMAEPWPLVMVLAIYELDKQFKEMQLEAKKKAAIEQDKK